MKRSVRVWAASAALAVVVAVTVPIPAAALPSEAGFRGPVLALWARVAHWLELFAPGPPADPAPLPAKHGPAWDPDG